MVRCMEKYNFIHDNGMAFTHSLCKEYGTHTSIEKY